MSLIVPRDLTVFAGDPIMSFASGFVSDIFVKESENKMSENRNHNTVRLARMGMLVAIAIVLVYFIRFPIFPAVAFLEYDPADIPILMGTFAFLARLPGSC